MVLKTQSISPLETIYEEADNFAASSIDISDQLDDLKRPHETINGLISARSIPTVNSRRKQIHEKPAIEVRFRDGSKRFIKPSTTLSMMINRRQLLGNPSKTSPSRKFATSKYQPLFHPAFDKKKFHSKVPLVITIITMEDLQEAGVTPPASSSTDDSEISTPTQSESNSSMKTRISIRQVPIQQSTVIHDQSHALSFPSKPSIVIPTPLAADPSVKPFVSTLQVTLTNGKNERHLSFNSNSPKMSSNLPTRASQLSNFPAVGSGFSSAFRPFLKPTLITPQIPFIVNEMSFYNSSPQQQPPYLQTPALSNRNHLAFSLLHKPKTVTINPKVSQAMSNASFGFFPNLQFFDDTSSSLFHVPQLSKNYLNIPSRITLPAIMPNHSQQLVCKQNNALERRLLNAGLSPEIIALYERILDISKSCQINVLAPPMYSLKSVI